VQRGGAEARAEAAPQEACNAKVKRVICSEALEHIRFAAARQSAASARARVLLNDMLARKALQAS
jgi:hypothetical protein